MNSAEQARRLATLNDRRSSVLAKGHRQPANFRSGFSSAGRGLAREQRQRLLPSWSLHGSTTGLKFVRTLNKSLDRSRGRIAGPSFRVVSPDAAFR